MEYRLWRRCMVLRLWGRRVKLRLLNRCVVLRLRHRCVVLRLRHRCVVLRLRRRCVLHLLRILKVLLVWPRAIALEVLLGRLVRLRRRRVLELRLVALWCVRQRAPSGNHMVLEVSGS